ncbi:MAG: DUF1549 and DUF1553 domain-containing protein [Verrucomicrobiales bacterium]
MIRLGHILAKIALVATTTPMVMADIEIEEGRQFWSFQPLAEHAIPVVKDETWPRSNIDRFLLARLEASNLTPAPDATRETLLRRITFALTGLPPTIAEQDAFLADKSARPIESAIDTLLNSDAFAERWARHWLDIVRYADTSGGSGAHPMPDAWRFRDYVIDSFRQDKPLNQLIREHIAGDLLPFSSYEQQIAQLTATGFLVLGPHNYGDQDKELLALDIVDEQIDTLGKAFLGMTIGCARCHDHEFDPIPAEDYYALAGIFLSTKSVADAGFSKWFTQPYPLSTEEESEQASEKARVASLEAEIADLKMRIKMQSEPNSVSEAGANPNTGNAVEKSDPKKLQAELKMKEDLRKELQEKKPPARPSIMGVAEIEQPKDTQVRLRGLPREMGKTVQRGFLQVVTSPGMPSTKIDRGSGRLELANWIASDKNPLTARVLANRIWQHLFGHGIVRSPDNFGTTGNSPTHPELLDHLALLLIQNGWSTKKLVREIVLSRAWQMASAGGDPNGAKLDPENELLWRANKRRIDAESLRDSILTLSGSLNTERGGPSLPPDFKTEFDFEITSLKRSIYIPAFRNRPEEIFSNFDFANPNFVVGKRFESTLPTQSLYLMNSPFIHQQSNLAEKQLLEKSADAKGAVLRTYRHILGRAPKDDEMSLTLHFLKSADFSSEARAGLVRSLFSCVDFQYIH